MTAFNWLRRLCVVTLALVLSTLPALGPSRSVNAVESTKEYQIKAAFLLNFVKFVRWPDDVLEPKQTFQLCIFGDDYFGPILEPMARRSIRERPVTIRRFDSQAKLEGCHLLFIAHQTATLEDNTLPDLARRGLLIVGDSPGLAERGAAINLITEDKKIRFEINIKAARYADLQMDGQLLRLGKLVSSQPHRTPF